MGIATTQTSRRSLLKWSAVAGGAAAVAGVTGCGGSDPNRSLTPEQSSDAGSQAIWNSCQVNCGSRCPLRMRVKDGVITRIEPDDTGDDTLGSQQVRACVRGRAIRRRVYNPDRLKTPMKRMGKRGEGKWKEISWDQAYTEIADSLKRIVAEYGNEAVYVHYSSGIVGGTLFQSGTSGSIARRLMNCYGGYLNLYGNYSAHQYGGAAPYIYGGSSIEANSFDDMQRSKLVVMFGNNPHETRMSGGGETFVTQQAKKLGGAKVIVIDPRYSDTAMNLADEWIPVRPGTDAALVAALVHVMVKENLHDQAFLDRYCQGFDEAHMPAGVAGNLSYRSYVLGQGPDGVAKTPEWGAKLTGIPATTIVRLAREIALAKPASINQGWGPQRQANGEATTRAICTLAAVIGQVGVPGGGSGGRESSVSLGYKQIPLLTNPVKTAISCFLWTDAIDHGPEMTALNSGVRGADRLKAPMKFIWNYAGNTLINQHSDVNRTIKLLEDDTKCEMIVVIDNHMTISAEYADILLPDVTSAERLDIAAGGSAGNMAYAILSQPAIQPMYDCKNFYEICTGVAEKLGVKDKFTEGRTAEDWVRYIIDENRKSKPDLPTMEEWKAKGIIRKKMPSVVAYDKFRADPVAHKLQTPSGKIEIFSTELHKMSASWQLPAGDKITPLPEYVETWEAHTDPLAKHYPLQCIGHHYKQRTHSTYGNVDWLAEAHPQHVWINKLDADARGIGDGDTVLIFNDRGRVRIPAYVTQRICPGVVSLPQGAWYKRGRDGTDVGGSVNVLTDWHPSPISKGNAQHTTLAEIRKA